MKEAVRTCLDVAKYERRGIRYSQKWLYECILLKLRSGRTYEYLINHNFLPLPSINTVRRYLKNLKPCYGFQTKLFEQLKEKHAHVSAMERRGVILIDEMKLTESLQFDKNELKVQGFVDLGAHTPEEKKNELGDHALVLLFQPFTGKWLQPIGSFLSRGAASNTVLYQILMEATILMENSGFYIDGVVSDGATWNRSMWTKFGVGKDACSCEHLCEESRRLWFFSDFPHLIKNLRNWMWKMGIFHTPDGTVQKQFWKDLLEADNPRGDGMGLKQCPKLTENHLQPAHYQKMNVALAYQIFDGTVSSAMEFFKNKNENLAGCGDTVNFIKRIRRLIDCMSGRYPRNALRDRGVEEIRSFLDYLDRWESICMLEDAPFLTDNTALGFKVTLTSTSELHEYLNQKQGFKYLMTARLNQDNLEKFFGMVRASGGNNDHPDSVMFAYIYKLLSAYSLLKTVKGSNVPEGERLTSFQSMMRENVLLGEENNDRTTAQEQWRMQMDRIVNGGELFDIINDESEFFTPLTEGESAALMYLCGYMVRNTSRFTTCSACIQSFAGQPTDEICDDLIKLRDYYGVLNYPSKRLYQLCECIEEVIITQVKDGKALRPDTFFIVADKLEGRCLPNVGCQECEHADRVTQKVLHFYLVMRMNFICRQFNKNLASSAKKKKQKQQKKNSKL